MKTEVTEEKQEFSVFGQRPKEGIFMADIPLSVRLNCKDGGVFIGGSEPKHRKSNPEDKIEIAILTVKKFYGDMGKTTDALWIQVFFVPVNSAVLPKNTVCVAYLKKQSIANLYGKVTPLMETCDPGMGIFILSFERQQGELGVYYTINFDWRERKTTEEMAQLDAISVFMQAYSDQLVDFDGTRDMTCVDGLMASELADIRRGIVLDEQQVALPSAKQSYLPKGR